MSSHRSGWVVEWRTPRGLVVARSVVWDEQDGRDYARTFELAYPALTPWLLGPKGGETRLAHSLRPWGGPAIEAPAPLVYA